MKKQNQQIKYLTQLSDKETAQISGGASDYLLRLDGIKGESADSKHDKWIPILSMSQ